MSKVSFTIRKPKGCSTCPLFYDGIWEHCVLLANGITGMTLPQGETFTHLAQTFHNFDETTAPKEIIDKIADGTYISPYCPLVEVKYNAR